MDEWKLYLHDVVAYLIFTIYINAWESQKANEDFNNYMI